MISLYTAQKGAAFTIAAVPNIALLAGMGLRVGSNIIVQHRYALGGPVLLRVEDTYTIALGKDVALHVQVTSAEVMEVQLA
jgi:Fe2+ transport system protein FeoA